MVPTDVDYDGEISQSYEDGRGLSSEAVATWRGALESHIPDAGLIVDVGAGTGRFARELDLLAPGRVLAVEPSVGMRESARRHASERVAWVGSSAEALPMANESVALVWSAFTTHYLDLDASADEFARVLKPGGRVLIWHAFPDVFDELEWFRWFPTARALDEHRMPSAAAVQKAFASAGFSFLGRSDHLMRIADNLAALADRLEHRSISTLSLISDGDFAQGLSDLRAEAGRPNRDGPVFAPNVLLAFGMS